MYSIRKLPNGYYECSVRYQDGTDHFEEPSLERAIQRTIRAAYSWNGMRIRRDDITIITAPPPTSVHRCTPDQLALLNEIDRGVKVVLDSNDYRLASRITPDEVTLIFAIREGEAMVSYPKQNLPGE